MKHSHKFIKHIQKLSNAVLAKKLAHHVEQSRLLSVGINPDDMTMAHIRKLVRHMNRADQIEMELEHRGLS